MQIISPHKRMRVRLRGWLPNLRTSMMILSVQRRMAWISIFL